MDQSSESVQEDSSRIGANPTKARRRQLRGISVYRQQPTIAHVVAPAKAHGRQLKDRPCGTKWLYGRETLPNVIPAFFWPESRSLHTHGPRLKLVTSTQNNKRLLHESNHTTRHSWTGCTGRLCSEIVSLGMHDHTTSKNRIGTFER